MFMMIKCSKIHEVFVLRLLVHKHSDGSSQVHAGNGNNSLLGKLLRVQTSSSSVRLVGPKAFIGHQFTRRILLSIVR